MPRCVIDRDDRLVYIGECPIGKLVDGVFRQPVTVKSIYRELNAKGMDIEVHASLKARGCWMWMLEFTDTLQVLTLPFDKVTMYGKKKQISGAGIQYFVALSDFTEKRPAVQLRLV